MTDLNLTKFTENKSEIDKNEQIWLQYLQVPISRTNYNRNSFLHFGVNAYIFLRGRVKF